MLSEQTASTGWESVHQRLKEHQSGDEDKWRLRDWDDHPNDPGWEIGTYSSCHGELREKARTGDIIFDTVYPGRPVDTTPIIRSVFVVEDISDNELSFSEFIFLDGEPNDGVRARMSRGHKRLDKTQVEEYVQQIEAREAYTRYSSGSKPDSIPQELWEKMLEKAKTDSNCPTCENQQANSCSNTRDDCD